MGISHDINTLNKKTRDGFLSTLFQIISSMLGEEFCQYIDSDFINFKGKTICALKIKISNMPCWINENNTYTFYIRTGNSTKPLNAKDAHNYILTKFEVK